MHILTVRKGADSPQLERARMYALDAGLVSIAELESYYKVFAIIERLQETRKTFRAVQDASLRADTYTAHWDALQRALEAVDGPDNPL